MKNMVYKKHLGKDRHKLEMAPLVDIVFQLLIFFLVATEFRPTEADFTTNLPGSGEGDLDMNTPEPDVHQVFLKRMRDGEAVEVTLDRVTNLGMMVAKEEEDRLQGRAFKDLERILRDAKSKSDDSFMLMIDGSPNVRIKFIAGALDAAVGAGVPRITFRGLNQ